MANKFAMVVGCVVLALWLAGLLGVGNFTISFGPAIDDAKTYTCHSGDGFWSRRKYACDAEEFATREAAGINAP